MHVDVHTICRCFLHCGCSEKPDGSFHSYFFLQNNINPGSADHTSTDAGGSNSAHNVRAMDERVELSKKLEIRIRFCCRYLDVDTLIILS